MPSRIAAILILVRVLLGYANHLDKTLPTQIDHPRFPTLAVGWGTRDLRRILAHVHRGLLRAIMLERYLLARAAADSDDPLHFAIPSLEELETQIRRRSIGRTITEICLDLGISPTICDSDFWNMIHDTLWHYGGSFLHFNEVHTHRHEAFQKERNQRPDTWTYPLWEQPRDAIRQILGFLPGEPNATAPPSG